MATLRRSIRTRCLLLALSALQAVALHCDQVCGGSLVPSSDPVPAPTRMETNPADMASMEGRIRALIRDNRWREALADARAFAAAQPAVPALKIALGEALYRAGRLVEARDLLEPLATLSPTLAVPPSPASVRAQESSAAPPSLPSPPSLPTTPPAPSSPPAPARALLVLGMIRVAEGREDEGATLLDRALSVAPSDRDVLFWAAGAAPTRGAAIERLERYLAVSGGDDPDRIEGAKGTIGLYRVLGERRVWIPVARPERLEAPMRALLDRQRRTTGFVVELEAGDGKRIPVLLDTGSPGLFLFERIATRVGFTPLAEQTTFAGGGEGRTPSRRGLIPSVGFRGLRYQDALVSTTTQEIEATGKYHGLLGLSFFQGYRVTLDLARERLVAERLPDSGPAPPPPVASPAVASHPASPSSTGLSTAAALPVALPSAASSPATPSTTGLSTAAARPVVPPAAASSPATPSSTGHSSAAAPPGERPGSSQVWSPYWTVSGQMLTEAHTSEGQSGLFLFDTGSARSLLSLGLVDAHQDKWLAGPLDLRTFGGAMKGATAVHGVRLRFQGRENDEPVLNAADLTPRSRLCGVEVSGFLGLDLLNRSRITIDTGARTVSITGKQ